MNRKLITLSATLATRHLPGKVMVNGKIVNGQRRGSVDVALTA
jgi:hypothetical protein